MLTPCSEMSLPMCIKTTVKNRLKISIGRCFCGEKMNLIQKGALTNFLRSQRTQKVCWVFCFEIKEEGELCFIINKKSTKSLCLGMFF